MRDRAPKRGSGLSEVRAVATGVVLGTVGRLAAERGVRFARQRTRHALSPREAEDLHPQRRDEEREASYGEEPEVEDGFDLQLKADASRGEAEPPALAPHPGRQRPRARPAAETHEDDNLGAGAIESPPTGASEKGASSESVRVAPAGGGPSSDDAMTRSEEELHVRTVWRERGRVRLRKYVVTEEVQRTISVRREEVRLEEEPSSGGPTGPETVDADVSGEEHQIVLYEEVPVITKRVVPRELVRIVKGTRREDAHVVEEARRERIEVERDLER
jgi:uncharacterized protein (TIGR02271 family)